MSVSGVTCLLSASRRSIVRTTGSFACVDAPRIWPSGPKSHARSSDAQTIFRCARAECRQIIFIDARDQAHSGALQRERANCVKSLNVSRRDAADAGDRLFARRPDCSTLAEHELHATAYLAGPHL